MYFETIVQFTRMLENLSHILDKANSYAQQKKFEPEILWQSRLAPDQFNFIRQVQITCDTAKFCAAFLANKEAPVYEDNEKNLLELQTRITNTRNFLQTFKAADFNSAASVKITRPRWEGKYLHGEEFLTLHAIPNFYFHVTTAYSILRHNGVDVGKKDYLGAISYKS
jgi:hypothetical protein